MQNKNASELQIGDRTDVRRDEVEEAARCIQRLYRSRMARKQLRDLLNSVFERFYDDESGCYYYHNKRTGETSWDKPKMLGEEEDVPLAVTEEYEQPVENDEEAFDEITFTKEELVLIQQQFDQYDVDHSGSISAKELQSLMQTLGEEITLEQVNALIQQVDENSNGEVEFDEFCAILRLQRQENPYAASLDLALLFGPTELANLKKQFTALDLDNSGGIDEKELEALIAKLDKAGKKFDVKTMMQEVDVDGSGSIGFNEFLRVVATMTRGDKNEKDTAFAALLAAGIAQGILTGLGDVIAASKARIYEWWNADVIAERKRIEERRERRRRLEERKRRQLEQDRALYEEYQAQIAELEASRQAGIDGLIMETEFEGDNKNFPQPGQYARVHYTARFAHSGEVFESTRKRAGALEFCVGQGHIIQGFDLALQRMSIGETARVTISPKLGYGVRGMPPRVPPDSTLVFKIELITIKEKLHLARDIEDSTNDA